MQVNQIGTYKNDSFKVDTFQLGNGIIGKNSPGLASGLCTAKKLRHLGYDSTGCKIRLVRDFHTIWYIHNAEERNLFKTY